MTSRGRAIVGFVGALCAVALAPSCRKPAPEEPARAPAPPPDPEIAKVDGAPLRLSAYKDRFARMPLGTTPVDALEMAVTDLLVVREMGVLGVRPKEGETTALAADRFLDATYKLEGSCPTIADPDLKWVYLREVGRFRHPEGWVVWEARWSCCEDADTCASDAARACFAATEADAVAFATRAKAQIEAIELPDEASEADAQVDDASGMPRTAAVRLRAPIFEALVAEEAARSPRLELLRYRFFYEFTRGPGDQRGYRSADEPLATAVRGAKTGSVVGPVRTRTGRHVDLVVAREPALQGGLANADVRKRVERAACREMHQLARNQYLAALRKGAKVLWHRDTIRTELGEAALAKPE